MNTYVAGQLIMAQEELFGRESGMIQRARLWLVICVLAMATLQLTAAVQQSFWEDEAFSALLIDQSSLREVVDAVARRDFHPPLYQLTLYSWSQLFGDTELALRSLSIVLMAGALLLVYRLGSELLDRRAAIFSMLLLTCSPFILLYGHDARYYAMSAFLSLLATYAMHAYLRSKRWVYLLLYLLSCIALVYTVYTAGLVIAACFLWGLGRQIKHRASLARVALWPVAHLAVPLAYLPWLAVLRLTVQDQATTDVTLSAMELLKRAGYLGFVFSVGETISPLSPIAWIGLVVTIGLFCFALIRLGRSSGAWMLFFFFGLIEGGNIMVNTFMAAPGMQNLPFRTLYAFPFFVLLLGYGLSRLRPRASLAVCGILLAVYGTGIVNFYTGRQFIKPVLAVPWHTIFATIESSSPEDTAIICNHVDSICPWYVRRYGWTPYFPEDAEQILAERPGQIWWIQSNRGEAFYDTAPEIEMLERVGDAYRSRTVDNYAFHDPSVRRFKAMVTPQQDAYEYRVNVYRFSEPTALAQD
jgi:hypothetical protein